jgi:hypothetical protein
LQRFTDHNEDLALPIRVGLKVAAGSAQRMTFTSLDVADAVV